MGEDMEQRREALIFGGSELFLGNAQGVSAMLEKPNEGQRDLPGGERI